MCFKGPLQKLALGPAQLESSTAASISSSSELNCTVAGDPLNNFTVSGHETIHPWSQVNKPILWKPVAVCKLTGSVLLCSISTVYRALCSLTQAPVIIKAYEKAKMKPKNFSRMEREVRLMRFLGGGDGLVELYAVFEDPSFKYLVRCMPHKPSPPAAH